jgi:hypothetical protein
MLASTRTLVHICPNTRHSVGCFCLDNFLYLILRDPNRKIYKTKTAQLLKRLQTDARSAFQKLCRFGLVGDVGTFVQTAFVRSVI